MLCYLFYSQFSIDCYTNYNRTKGWPKKVHFRHIQCDSQHLCMSTYQTFTFTETFNLPRIIRCILTQPKISFSKIIQNISTPIKWNYPGDLIK